ncbi:alternative oxidase, mitochondrial-like [Capsicum annuum]|nr:alternative oxidase, mitochondrial-like [Capsicum annuum]
MTYLEYDSECKLYLESNILVQRKEMPEAANADKLSELELENAYDEQRENATQSDELPLPSNFQLAQVESCQILGTNSVGVQLSHSLENISCIARNPKDNRVVGHLEEEAIHLYTLYLNDIDRGEIENFPALAIAIDYWRLPKDATLKDVDEAYHRDVNHFASPWETH